MSYHRLPLLCYVGFVTITCTEIRIHNTLMQDFVEFRGIFVRVKNERPINGVEGAGAEAAEGAEILEGVFSARTERRNIRCGP